MNAEVRSDTHHDPVPRPGWVVRAALRLAATRAGGWFFTTVTPPLDRALLKRSRGRFSLAGIGLPTLLLTTTGRKSGLARSAPLLYLPHDLGFIVVGSRGGRRGHAAWYLNLLAEPSVEVTVAGSSVPCRAKELEGRDRATVWAQLTALNPGFSIYQARLDRRIPILLLERSAP